MHSTIQSVAKEALNYFKTSKRIDGNEYVHTENEPSWVNDLCRVAHSDGHSYMLPDDWRYRFIEEALREIIEVDDSEDPSDLRVQPDDATHDLLSWVSSRTDRPAYCDEAQGEGFFTQSSTFMERIQAGQYLEKNEVLSSVLASLQERLNEMEGN